MFETEMTVVGTLITAVDRRCLAGGSTKASFRVASNSRRFDRGSEGWVDGDSLFVSVTAWRALAENVHASFRIGDPIIVRGRVYSDSYEKDGRRQWITRLEASAVGPDLTRSTAVVTRTRRGGVESAASAAGPAGSDEAWTSPGEPPAEPDDVFGEGDAMVRTGAEIRTGGDAGRAERGAAAEVGVGV